ncbi:hypothetical protein JHL18_18780 [Clostridium sp. YIM B02505]|uniref:Uncharacterized protein n=1 Tax=Clostridium yunnanense TaxID=2800325 RepID=A0ABS1ETK6_9CLOT|nr:hypothetical protein [Clostridium yunnanense]MBK1812669.1 hypothetical protein [Clostridium yunnanense]
MGNPSSLAKIGGESSALPSNLLTKEAIIKELDGVTPKSTEIANAIKNGDLKVTTISDRLFDMWVGEGAQARAVGDHLYLRSSSKSYYSDVVHEGIHGTDFLNGYGAGKTKTTWQWEKRAYYYERQFQINSGRPVDYKTLPQMLYHIKHNYPEVLRNPND